MRRDFSQQELRDKLFYDPDTGIWTWLVSFNNGTKIGDIAGDIKNNGHRFIGIFGGRYLSSRLAWFYMTGSWPDVEVDHKDTDPLNNRWDNLRLATRQQNMANTRPRNNKIGFKGVSRCRAPRLRSERYSASIKVNYQRIYLGTFKTPEEAHNAYRDAARRYFGEYARTE